jgi:hypothetical protein
MDRHTADSDERAIETVLMATQSLRAAIQALR